jgi:23S rRNA pseudouridine2605 synthase
MELLRGVRARVYPVGRLDYHSEGLLLLTNDGELKRAMELPSSGIPRTYRARTFGNVTQNQLEELIEGVTIDGMHYGRIDANMERRTGRNQWIELTLTEGKNREVRRVLEHLGLQVSRLLRISYGPFVLGDLPRGAAGEIRQVDVERFRKTLGATGGAMAPILAPLSVAAPAARRPEGELPAPPKTPAPKPKRKPARQAPVRDGRPPGPGGGKRPSPSGTRRSPSPGARRRP